MYHYIHVYVCNMKLGRGIKIREGKKGEERKGKNERERGREGEREGGWEGERDKKETKGKE